MEAAIRWFPFLRTIGHKQLVRSGLRRVTVPAGTPAFTEGEPCPHVAFVVGGGIRVYKAASDGRQLTLYHVPPGDSCVLMLSSVLADTGYPAHAAAASDSELYVLPVGEFRRWMERYEPVHRFVYESMAKRLTAVLLLVDEIVFRHIDERLAAWLLQKTSGGEATVHTTHEQIALELGTAREVVSRILKSFESAGAVVLHRGRIDVIDRNALADMRPPSA